MPGVRFPEFIPNETAEPAATVAGKVTQLSELERLTVGVPVVAEIVEDLLSVVPPCTTEKESDVGENDNLLCFLTFTVTSNIASA